MTFGGWILLTISWGIIMSVVIYCFAKMFVVDRGKK